VLQSSGVGSSQHFPPVKSEFQYIISLCVGAYAYVVEIDQFKTEQIESAFLVVKKLSAFYPSCH